MIDRTHVSTGRGRQSWTQEVTANVNGHKVRAHVTRDFYDFQSRIYVEVFSPEKLRWNRLQTLSGTDHGSLVSATCKDDLLIARAAEPVIDDLLTYAESILPEAA